MIEIEDVSKTYTTGEDDVRALEDVSLSIERGEFLSIVGPTGCGKSTLLSIIAGLVEPTTGRVRKDGQPVTGPSEDIGVVFQEDSTLPWRTTLGNVEFGMEMNGVAEAERRERAREMLDLVGLDGFEDAYPRELSGGMRQRVAIARTLVMEPAVTLMDEPFGALDEQTRLVLGEELLRIWRQTDQTTVFVTHSLTEAAHLSDRVLVMTARPGTVKSIVPVDIERPRGSDVLSTQEFNSVTDRIWSELRDEARQTLS